MTVVAAKQRGRSTRCCSRSRTRSAPRCRCRDRVRGPAARGAAHPRRAVRRVAGVLALVAASRSRSTSTALQTAIPGYTGVPGARRALDRRAARARRSSRAPVRPRRPGTALSDAGGLWSLPRPGASRVAQLQAADDEGLRGRIVVIDFWTYSCIDCLARTRTSAAWDDAYAPRGPGSRSPHAEFAFEQVPSNVRGRQKLELRVTGRAGSSSSAAWS